LKEEKLVEWGFISIYIFIENTSFWLEIKGKKTERPQKRTGVTFIFR